MTTITTRAGKGAPLTNAEVDANFTGLNAGKLEKSSNLSDLDNAATARTNLGLGNVNNTSDANKPVSTAAQAALNLKADAASPTTTGTLTHSGDIVLSGSGKRITGDFSNATLGNRAVFQTSTVNGSTGVFVAPNGTGTASFWLCSTSSSVNNSSIAYIGADPSQVSFQSDKTGTGTYLPMTFYTGGSERMRIDTNGNVLVDGNNLKLFSNKSLANNGYQKLPSGLIIQWGEAAATTTGATVTWPIAFPNNCLSVAMSNQNSTNVISEVIIVSNTSGSAYCGSGTVSIKYIAIGY